MKLNIHPSLSNITALAVMAVALLFSSPGCETFDCLEGNGKLQTENRAIDPFTEISSQGDFEVVVIQDTFTSLDIEAEDNILPYISTRTEDGKLVIKVRDQRCLKNTKTIKITVRTPTLEVVDLEGSGNITCDSLNSKNLDINILGSGDIEMTLDSTSYLRAGILGSGNIYLKGICTESELKIGGSGNIKAEGLRQETVFANISGSGNMYLWVTKFLDVKISGSGSVYYDGSPTVNVSITGSGSVIHSK
jgi:hypothetical protein